MMKKLIKKVLNESRFEKMGEDNYKSCSMSDITRMEIIDGFLKQVQEDPNYNIDEPDYDMLLDDWDGYDDQVYIQNKLNENKIIFYEGWVNSCWNAVYQKPQYEGLSKKEVIEDIITKRFPRIADEFNMEIDDYGYIDDGGYIMYVTLKNKSLNESTYFLRRFNKEEMEEEFMDSLKFVSKSTLDPKSKWYKMPFESFKRIVINVMMDGFHPKLSNWGEHDFPYDEVNDFLFEYYSHDILVAYYNIMRNLNESIVYRGQSDEFEDISPRHSVWVTNDKEFAKVYGKVKKYKLPNDLNILDTYYYSEWESLVDEFDEDGDYEEYKYEPPTEFIEFLKSKGYDGFQNNQNILIFDKNNLH